MSRDAESATSSVPPSAPVGWRIWVACRSRPETDDPHVLRSPFAHILHSPTARTPWLALQPPDRTTAAARCWRPLLARHHAPRESCACGWYALKSGHDALHYDPGALWRNGTRTVLTVRDEQAVLIVTTLVAVLPPYVAHRAGWRAQRLALLGVVDWPSVIELIQDDGDSPPLYLDQARHLYDTAHAWRAAIARAYGVPLIPPDVAVREFGAEE